MMFRRSASGVLAVSQLAHAWISGQLLRAWAEPLGEPLLLAAEQHDVGWIDWERRPSFDPRTGLPHLFRDVGAAEHAPMWAEGVERSLAAWGAHVALLISRHGGVIYRRFLDRHRATEADGLAAEHYLDTQAPREAGWAAALGLDAARLERETALLALADTLSLALCGELAAPLTVEAPDRNGGLRPLRLTADGDGGFALSPWPFGADAVAVECEARPVPAPGRFEDEAAMRGWLYSARRVGLRARLAPGR